MIWLRPDELQTGNLQRTCILPMPKCCNFAPGQRNSDERPHTARDFHSMMRWLNRGSWQTKRLGGVIPIILAFRQTLVYSKEVDS